MKFRFLFLEIITAVALGSWSWAENAKSEKVEVSGPVSEPAVETALPTINESWYTLWGLGFARIRYNDQVQKNADSLSDQSGVENFSGTYDVFGFYWPLAGHRTMLGFVLNGSFETWENANARLRVSHETYSFSAHHFWGANIGSGWFVRGDIGIARAREDRELGNTAISLSTDPGWGMLVGGGYGFAIGRETRLLVNLNLSRRKIDSFEPTTLGLTAGFLF